ncbi:HNH endonuclease [Halobacterium salinarum]|uniref:HNH endonuclease signature motif containing protein n=1 Tax=Halobacterium salinarum TaxID=2242 RepID=UPI00255519CE|nr:HNH endonuclease [Halobacterium salinarum]MDL0127832.1 HNH endonuclease [Halobacterium salinarum]
MRSEDLEEAVLDRWGNACVVCGRRPEEWLDTDLGERRQDKLSFHHVNGDDTDDRIDNIIPLCQSCHVHIHRVDDPPYRMWHRQLPSEHRHAWNAHYEESYEGPRLTREEAVRRFSDEEGTPESVKYLKHERENFDPDNFTTNATPGTSYDLD